MKRRSFILAFLAPLPATAQPADVLNYVQNITHRLSLYRTYPASARAAKQEGRVVILVVLDRNGHVVDVGVLQSSGIPAIDEQELLTVKVAAPFGPLPDSIKTPTAKFAIPVSYVLKELPRPKR